MPATMTTQGSNTTADDSELGAVSGVLVADDSPLARAMIVRRLRASGRAVVEHASAADASRVDATPLACALLDFDLGDGLGTDVAARLRATHGASFPIAFFTTSPSDALARAASFGPVFTKPDELDAAVAWVEQHAPIR